MKSLLRITIVLLLVFSSAFAKKRKKHHNSIDKQFEKEYQKYKEDIYKRKDFFVKELLNYKIELPKTIFNPFGMEIKPLVYERKFVKKVVVSRVVNRKVKKPLTWEKLQLKGILNNQAYVSLYKNGKLVTTKWIEEGKTIGSFRLLKVLSENAILVKNNNKTQIIKIKTKKACVITN